jgi:hypothetical protein
VSWIPILIIASISFGLGALWHSKHAAERKRNLVQRDLRAIEVERLDAWDESTTAYNYGRKELKFLTGSSRRNAGGA